MNDFNSEIVLGIITTVGTDTTDVIRYIQTQLAKFSYDTEIINVSSEIIANFDNEEFTTDSEYERINHYMDLGNHIREKTKDATIIMQGVVAEILSKRDNIENPSPRGRTAYIIKSIKHPKEADYLKQIYGDGFHLIGITSDLNNRYEFLEDVKSLTHEQATELINRDSDEAGELGQHTQDAFQNSDYFINVTNNTDEIKNCVFRLVDLLFGNPFITPTFDEYAMFMAYAASLRSADLSRQVGAVVTKNNEILTSGANDCPRYKGGLYWQLHKDNKYFDEDDGRDYTIGYDSNKKEQTDLINKILENLKLPISDENVQLVRKSGIGSLTEYGRVVHAEMEALLACARNNISSMDSIMYMTTFPCHNCAKHIIAAGVVKVVYIEPYPKSKAVDFYRKEISTSEQDSNNKVVFIPFSGVGPRRYIDLFAMTTAKWGVKKRKNNDGKKINWDRKESNIRSPMLPMTYLDYEKVAYKSYYEEIEAFEKEKENE
ncbi:MAG: cytidine deaminase [Clostridia bacterium]|nr:cytidine deaminase [Clostridia bacterium]